MRQNSAGNNKCKPEKRKENVITIGALCLRVMRFHLLMRMCHSKLYPQHILYSIQDQWVIHNSYKQEDACTLYKKVPEL